MRQIGLFLLLASTLSWAEVSEFLVPLRRVPAELKRELGSVTDIDDLNRARAETPALFCGAQGILESSDTLYRSKIAAWIHSDPSHLKNYFAVVEESARKKLEQLGAADDPTERLWEIVFRYPFTQAAESAVRQLMALAIDRGEPLLALALESYPGRPLDAIGPIFSPERRAELEKRADASPLERLSRLLGWGRTPARVQQNWLRVLSLLGPKAFTSVGLPDWLDRAGCDVLLEAGAGPEYQGSPEGIENLYRHLDLQLEKAELSWMRTFFQGKFAANNLNASGLFDAEGPRKFVYLQDSTRRELAQYWLEAMRVRPVSRGTQASLYRLADLFRIGGLEVEDATFLPPFFSLITHLKVRHSQAAAESGILPALFNVLELLRRPEPQSFAIEAGLALSQIGQAFSEGAEPAYRDGEILFRLLSWIPQAGPVADSTRLALGLMRDDLSEGFRAAPAERQGAWLRVFRNLGPQASPLLPLILERLEAAAPGELGESEFAIELLETWALIPEDGSADPDLTVKTFARFLTGMQDHRSQHYNAKLTEKAIALLDFYPQQREVIDPLVKNYSAFLRGESDGYGEVRGDFLADQLDKARERVPARE